MIKNFFITCLYLFSYPISLTCDCYVIGSLLGQAGNNFFQIAATQATAWDHGAEAYFPELVLTPTAYHHYFSRCKIDPPSDAFSISWSGPICDFTPIPYQPSMKVGGYLQSWKYFDHHKERLQKLFAPIAKDAKYIQKKYGSLISDPCSVAIQLRYFALEAPSFPQYGKDYLQKAMDLFPHDALFIVSTNNLAFAKEEVPQEGRRVFFLEDEPSYIDFYTLTFCKHAIISNSTFGWWAAYLNTNPAKVVVCPKIWLFKGKPDIELATKHPELYPQEHPDVYPPDWIQIDASPIF